MYSDAHACRLFSPAYTLLPPRSSQLAVIPRLSQDGTISLPFRSMPNLMSLCQTCARLEPCKWPQLSGRDESLLSFAKAYEVIQAAGSTPLPAGQVAAQIKSSFGFK